MHGYTPTGRRSQDELTSVRFKFSSCLNALCIKEGRRGEPRLIPSGGSGRQGSSHIQLSLSAQEAQAKLIIWRQRLMACVCASESDVPSIRLAYTYFCRPFSLRLSAQVRPKRWSSADASPPRSRGKKRDQKRIDLIRPGSLALVSHLQVVCALALLHWPCGSLRVFGSISVPFPFSGVCK